MKVVKVINNNLIKSYDEQHNEILVMGCGLGFKKSPGDEVNTSAIEKIYTCADKTSSHQLIGLLEKIPLEHVQVTNEIISFAKASLGKRLNENIYITLTDHIDFAIERHKNGVVLTNALLWEIKKFYSHEFLVGKEALSMIHRKLGVILPEDEAAFIALHLVNASTEELSSMSKATEMTRMMQNIINIIKEHFQIELDEYSIHYERFVTHLKFFAQRVFTNNILEEQDINFLSSLKEQCKNEYRCTLKIKDYMKKEFNCDLTEDEMIYLTIHIKRITAK
ncbi:BglG family transcription antiterminator LicT [Anaeromicropila populeti]|uniref:Transcriptional antiterminator, BglG family n=1 Tax=Anaeromicropila populeti TaxID=37658 RepID=A0A1I6KSV2_9FIRM|nr:PRD domain-containing protein [Anaeromicropila populeti]SFR94108.1 transcriptional antiterminator, BglG family [Anaeromicropila populeti]